MSNLKTYYDESFVATVRHDDRCGNGHNTFSVTADYPGGGGACHDLIVQHFPELEPVLKFHGCSEDGPLHYIANTTYWAKEGRLDYARKTAIWPDASDEDLTAPGLKERLQARLPALLQEFRAAVEGLGLEYGRLVS